MDNLKSAVADSEVPFLQEEVWLKAIQLHGWGVRPDKVFDKPIFFVAYSHKCWFFKHLHRLQVVRMAVGDNHQINLIRGEAQICQSLPHMAEKMSVAGVDQDFLRPIDKIRIAIIGGDIAPDEGMEVIRHFHESNPPNGFG